MNKNFVRVTSAATLFSLMLGLSFAPVDAAVKKPKLASKTVTVKTGAQKTVKIKNAVAKTKVSATVKNKAIATVKCKPAKGKKSALVIKGKKKGSTKVDVKVKQNNKTYKLTLKVTVKVNNTNSTELNNLLSGNNLNSVLSDHQLIAYSIKHRHTVNDVEMGSSELTGDQNVYADTCYFQKNYGEAKSVSMIRKDYVNGLAEGDKYKAVAFSMENTEDKVNVKYNKSYTVKNDNATVTDLEEKAFTDGSSDNLFMDMYAYFTENPPCPYITPAVLPTDDTGLEATYYKGTVCYEFEYDNKEISMIFYVDEGDLLTGRLTYIGVVDRAEKTEDAYSFNYYTKAELDECDADDSAFPIYTQADAKTIGESFYMSEITDDIYARIYGDKKSFKTFCTTKREDLRYLHVKHVDNDGVEKEGEMIVNYRIAADVYMILQQLYLKGYPIEKIRLVDEYDADDETSMRDNNSSAFNFRYISGTTRPSKHGLGLAVDINTLYNPYYKVKEDGTEVIEPATGAKYLDRNLDFIYKIERGDDCFNAFINRGFEWGGDWSDRKDYQHFEVKTEVIKDWYPEWYEAYMAGK